MLKIIYADISPLYDNELFESFVCKLSEESRRRIYAAKLTEERLLCAGTRILIARAIERCGFDERGAEYEYGTNGKPYFKNIPLFFSLSHSGTIASVALSDTVVGCDIEKISTRDFAGLSQRYFGSDECKSVLISENKSKIFFEIWTAREAYAKFTGKGLGAITGKEEYENCFFGKCEDIPGYILSWCAEKDEIAEIEKENFRR